jgi:molybdenum cofactor cytidylyltransferase
MISAIVLAAGQAARFGQCKQLMQLGDKTLIEHVLDTVNESAVDDIIVVLGAHADEIQRRVKFGRERIVLNAQYAEGMSTSIHAGLRALTPETEAAIIMLADQPFVTPQTVNRLAGEYRTRKALAIVPTYRGARGNPVLVDRSLFPEMLALRGDVGFRAIFEKHPDSIVKLPIDDVGIVTDIDTREDFNDLARR